MDDATNAYPLTDDLDRIDWMIDEGRFEEASAISLRALVIQQRRIADAQEAQVIQQARIADALEKLTGLHNGPEVPLWIRSAD